MPQPPRAAHTTSAVVAFALAVVLLLLAAWLGADAWRAAELRREELRATAAEVHERAAREQRQLQAELEGHEQTLDEARRRLDGLRVQLGDMRREKQRLDGVEREAAHRRSTAESDHNGSRQRFKEASAQVAREVRGIVIDEQGQITVRDDGPLAGVCRLLNGTWLQSYTASICGELEEKSRSLQRLYAAMKTAEAGWEDARDRWHDARARVLALEDALDELQRDERRQEEALRAAQARLDEARQRLHAAGEDVRRAGEQYGPEALERGVVAYLDWHHGTMAAVALLAALVAAWRGATLRRGGLSLRLGAP